MATGHHNRAACAHAGNSCTSEKATTCGKTQNAQDIRQTSIGQEAAPQHSIEAHDSTPE
jgi:hypothetical protein